MNPKKEERDWLLVSIAILVLFIAILKYWGATITNASDALGAPIVSLIFGFVVIGCYRRQIGDLLGRLKTLGSKGLEFEPTAAGQVVKVEPHPEGPRAKEGRKLQEAATAAVSQVIETATTVESTAQKHIAPLSAAGWEAIYLENRNIFLVHEFRPSSIKAHWYDIYIYLSNDPTQTNNLPLVEKAEFYLGPDWSLDPFVVFPGQTERIGIETKAWGEILCTCRVTFKDESNGKPKVIHLNRWIDFQMKWALEPGK